MVIFMAARRKINRAGASTKPTGNQIYFPGEKCYVCGKTEADFSGFRDDLIAKYEMMLASAEKKLESQTAKIEKILDGGIPENFLGFKLETIKNDLDNFMGMIPNLGTIYPYRTPWADKYSKQETLGDVVNRLRETPEKVLESPEMGDIRNEIIRAKKELQRLVDGETMNISLRQKKVDIRLPGGNVFNISICPICDALFKEASGAAYRKRMNDDD